MSTALETLVSRMSIALGEGMSTAISLLLLGLASWTLGALSLLIRCRLRTPSPLTTAISSFWNRGLDNYTFKTINMGHILGSYLYEILEFSTRTYLYLSQTLLANCLKIWQQSAFCIKPWMYLFGKISSMKLGRIFFFIWKNRTLSYWLTKEIFPCLQIFQVCWRTSRS